MFLCKSLLKGLNSYEAYITYIDRGKSLYKFTDFRFSMPYVKKLKADRIICSLCSHQCIIPPGGVGYCKVRKNKKGKLEVLNLKKVSNEYSDYIENKNIFHFLPGSKTYVVEGVGNNFNQHDNKDPMKTSCKSRRVDHIISRAKKEDCRSICFNENEPTISYENVLEISKKAKSERIKSVVVTNGYIHEKPLYELSKHLHGVSFMLDVFDRNKFGERNNGAKLFYVIKSIRNAVNYKLWVEVQTNINKGVNDNKEELKKMADGIASINKEIPWVVSNELEDFDNSAVKEAAEEAGLKHYYVGKENTYCKRCKREVINRKEKDLNVKRGLCGNCKNRINGFF